MQRERGSQHFNVNIFTESLNKIETTFKHSRDTTNMNEEKIMGETFKLQRGGDFTVSSIFHVLQFIRCFFDFFGLSFEPDTYDSCVAQRGYRWVVKVLIYQLCSQRERGTDKPCALSIRAP